MTPDTSLVEELERLEKQPIEPWSAEWYEDVARLRNHLPSIISALKENKRLLAWEQAHADAMSALRLQLRGAEAENKRLREALAVPEVWSQTERDGMAAAFNKADGKHGHYETLFAVAAWLLRHRVRWLATEDGSVGKGTGRHIAAFILQPQGDAKPWSS